MNKLTLLWLALVSVCVTFAIGQESTTSESAARELPEWIWATGDSARQRTATLKRDFHCEGAITAARLQLAADFASCSVFLNGETVAVVDDFGPLLSLDVAQHLRLGENTIVLQAESRQGPAAVAATLQITADGHSAQQIVTDSSWQTVSANSEVASPGKVFPGFWTNPARGRITAFDDYTQWKLAQTENAGAEQSVVAAPPGFEVELLRKAGPEEGSWVSLAFDPLGRLTIAREDKGLLRLTLATADQVESMETINDTLLECRGLLYAFGDLYANANNSKGLYRLHDADGDDQFDDVKLLREFPGGVGHGRNDIALGPDGLIYSIHGDSVNLPQTGILDLTSPFRDGALKSPQTQGHLVRGDKDGKHWELVATGLRNPFGIDFNDDGELFTYDADAEFDMGAPWYRPTRVDQLVSGADFGWRGLTNRWPPYELDHADNALPTATIGKGSPTAVKFGTGSHFPEVWRNSLFILDWAYGRIVACQLFPRGSGYVCRNETFLKGRPLNLTDIDFGPDGAMYVITGGRKTESALYRVRWTSGDVEPVPTTTHHQARVTYSAAQRELRRQLEQWHRTSDSDDAVEAVWPFLASPDPVIRQAARVALEHQKPERWQQRALSEVDPSTSAVALLALARMAKPQVAPEIVPRLIKLPLREVSAYDRLTALQAWSLCLADTATLDAALLQRAKSHLSSWLAQESASTTQYFAPTGTGRSVVAKLSRLVMQLDQAVASEDVVRLLQRSTQQEDRIHYLRLLSHASTGWHPEDRELFFEILRELDLTVIGGDGMPGFLKRIREAAVASLNDSERLQLGDLIVPIADTKIAATTITRTHVRDWTVADIDDLLPNRNSSVGDPLRGRELFSAALCSRCHRVGHRGGVTGPDLTSVGSRFSTRDILKSILEPSDVVAEKYRNIQIVTKAGKTVVGRVISSGDYRSPTLRISTDPLDASKTVEVAKIDVDLHRESILSPMPKGLLATFTAEDIADLLAYVSGASNE